MQPSNQVHYWTDRSKTRGDVWVQTLDGSKAVAIAATPFNERRPRFGPDGRFVAYDPDELGQPEVFIQPVLYEPLQDGSRFLVQQIGEPPAQPIMVVLDWPARLNRK